MHIHLCVNYPFKILSKLTFTKNKPMFASKAQHFYKYPRVNNITFQSILKSLGLLLMVTMNGWYASWVMDDLYINELWFSSFALM